MPAKQKPVHKATDRVTLRRRGKKKLLIAHFHADGQHRAVSTHTDKLPQAIKIAERITADLYRGDYSPPARQLKLDDLSKRYLDHLRTTGKSLASFREYERQINFLLQFCRLNRISTPAQFTPQVLDAFAQYRADPANRGPERRGRKVTNPAAAAYKARNYAKMLFTWLLTRSYIKSNPIQLVPLQKHRSARPLPPLMVNALRIVELAPPEQAAYLAVLALTGMRISELCRLTPSDIDLTEGFIAIRSTPTQKTKNGMSRSVPIHPALRPHLQAALAAAKDSPTLFTARSASRALRPPDVRPWIARLAKQLKLPAGVKEHGWTPHVYRHCLKAHAVNHRVSELAVNEWLGHTGDGSAPQIYFSLTRDESLRLMTEMPLPTVPPISPLPPTPSTITPPTLSPKPAPNQKRSA